MSLLKKLFGAREQRLASGEDIRFVREEKDEVKIEENIFRMCTVERVCRFHIGRGDAAALRFLAENPITRMHEYLIVQTREGDYWRDFFGIVDESAQAPGDPSKLLDFGHGTLVVYGGSGDDWLGEAAKAISATKAEQAYEAQFRPVGLSDAAVAAVFPRLPIGQHAVHLPDAPEVAGLGPMAATIEPAKVTELRGGCRPVSPGYLRRHFRRRL